MQPMSWQKMTSACYHSNGAAVGRRAAAPPASPSKAKRLSVAAFPQGPGRLELGQVGRGHGLSPTSVPPPGDGGWAPWVQPPSLSSCKVPAQLGFPPPKSLLVPSGFPTLPGHTVSLSSQVALSARQARSHPKERGLRPRGAELPVCPGLCQLSTPAMRQSPGPGRAARAARGEVLLGGLRSRGSGASHPAGGQERPGGAFP